MSAKTIVIYSKTKGCVQCDATNRTLAKTDLSFIKLDATTPENRQAGLDLGHMQAPVIVVYQDGEIVHHFSGFNPGELERLKNDPLVERVPSEAHGLAA